MTAVKFLIIIIAIVAALYGLKEGVIRQLGSLLALFCAVLACRVFGDALSGVVEKMIGGGEKIATAPGFESSFISNIVVFLIVFIAVKVLAGVARKLTHMMMLGVLDRTGGAVFALVEWLTGLSLVLNLWIVVFPDGSLGQAMIDGTAGRMIEIVMKLGPMLLGSEYLPTAGAM